MQVLPQSINPQGISEPLKDKHVVVGPLVIVTGIARSAAEMQRMRAMSQQALVCMSEANGVNFGKGGGRIEGMESWKPCRVMEDTGKSEIESHL